MIMYIYIKYKPLIKEKKRDTYADRQIIGNLDIYVSDILSKYIRKRERERKVAKAIGEKFSQ